MSKTMSSAIMTLSSISKSASADSDARKKFLAKLTDDELALVVRDVARYFESLDDTDNLKPPRISSIAIDYLRAGVTRRIQ